jgi:AmiR/NasT family two-component response regulator
MRCSILIVMKQQETSDQISSILNSRGYNVTDTCISGMQGLRSAGNHPSDIVIVGFSLTDMTGLEFADDLLASVNSSVLMIVPPEQMSYAKQNIGNLDIALIAKPISPQSLITSVDLTIQFRDRLQRMQNETQKLKLDLERRALAEKAKTALMTSLGLSESEAWKQIQKQSMESRKPLEQIARHILDIYG